MSDLTITLTGEVRESNFDEWKDDLVTRIRAVDVDLSADDEDLSSANESIRQFRQAEQTLKAAKQAALEQAADINRLFDAVDAVTEETRQARLSLERRIRSRRHEIKQQSLQAHAEANAGTLDALPATHRALFQDRSTLLHLPTEELEATIEQRIAVWRSARAQGDEWSASERAGAPAAALASPSSSASGVQSSTTDETADDDRTDTDAALDGSGADDPGAGHPAQAGADEAVRGWHVTIALRADRTKADHLFARVRDRWSTDRAVSGVELSASD